MYDLISSSGANGNVNVEFKPLVSLFPNAYENLPTDIPAAEFIKGIQGKAHSALVAIIRQRFKTALERGVGYDRAKRVVDSQKKKLPCVSFAGVLPMRDKMATPQFTGLFQADLDLLGHRLPEIRRILREDPHVYALFVSPRGEGLKAIYRVPICGNAAEYKLAFAAVSNRVQDLTGVEIDRLEDFTRLCFSSHDPDASVNPKAIELPVDFCRPAEETNPPPTGIKNPDLKFTQFAAQSRRNVAERILGAVEWQDHAHGTCQCPGEAHHTTEEKPHECQVHLDRVPTIHCLHKSCESAVAEANHCLRSEIGRAERLPPVASSNLPNMAAAQPVVVSNESRSASFPPDRHELSVLAAAIDAGSTPLPTCIGKLIQNGPESFVDAQVGQIAVIVRDMRLAGEPVDYAIISEKCLPHLTFNSAELMAATVSLEVAEFYAMKCWQAYQVRRARSIGDELVSSLNSSPKQAPAIIAAAQGALDYLTRETTNGLPELVDAAAFIAALIPAPAELVAGILHKGSKLVLGGSSKSFKTWTLLDLAIVVATGTPWLGRLTVQGRVLFVNFEIQPHAWQRRIVEVARAKGVELQAGQIILWNLRGHATDFRLLIPLIIQCARQEGFALIILDPIYKLYGGTDENAAGDVAELLNSLEKLATETGAATAFGAHFAKGNASGKQAIDRISGSGVFARDPDSLLIFTKHEADGAFTVEPILRNFAPATPFAVRWEYPLMQLADDLDPAKLKQAGGRKKQHVLKELLAAIAGSTPEKPISIAAWAVAADIARQTLTDYLPVMRRNDWIQTVGTGNAARQFITNKGKAFIHDSPAGN